MYPQPLTLSPHFSPTFSDAASFSRRAVCAGGKAYHVDPSTGQAVCRCHLTAPSLPLSPGHNSQHSSGPAARNSPNHSPVAVHLPPFTAVRATGLHEQLSVSGLGKDPMTTARTIPIGGPYTPAALAAYHPYLYAGYEAGGIRKAAVRETTGPLKAWLHEHKKNPYPTKAEKVMLAIITQMTLTQVSTWFANARRRLKKETRGSWDGGPDHDDDKDSTGRLEGKDADSTMADHYENFSDVSVDDDDDDDTAALRGNNSTTPSESRLHPVPPPSLHPHPHPLLVSPHPHPHPSLPLRPELTSSNARNSGSGNGSGNRSNTDAAPAPKPRIWSISSIIGLDEKDKSEEEEKSSGDINHSDCVNAESDSADSGVGESEPSCSTSSSHGSPVSAASS